MRILFTRFPYESTFGGAEIQTLSLMKGLRERGHAVAFLGSCPTLIRETAASKLPHAKLEIGPPPVSKWHLMTFCWRQKRMRAMLEAALSGFHDLDAMFMLSLSEKILLTETAVKNGTRVFWIEHDRVGPWLTKNPWLPTLRKLSRAVTTICVSELSRQIYINLGWDPEKVIAIPNGIDLDRFQQPATSNQPTSNSLRIGCIARLSQEKGVDVLIHAVKNLPNIEITIVGRGPEEERLRSMLTPSINILSSVENLSDFYRSIDVFILPSRDNDPFGLVAAESMACGTPVIVTDQCGIAGYLRDGEDAVIVKADSSEELTQGIRRMMDVSLRAKIATNGKATAMQKFSVEDMVDAYERLLK